MPKAEQFAKLQQFLTNKIDQIAKLKAIFV